MRRLTRTYIGCYTVVPRRPTARAPRLAGTDELFNITPSVSSRAKATGGIGLGWTKNERDAQRPGKRTFPFTSGEDMPSEVRFADIRRSLEQHGWTLIRIKGSHHHFCKEGEARLITLAVHKGRVAPEYVKQIKKDHGIECS